MKLELRLKEKRDIKRLSQQEVADILNISQRTYSNYESNKTEPSLYQLSVLAKILDFDLLELIVEQGFILKNYKNNDIGNNIYNTGLSELITLIEKSLSKQQEFIKILKEKEKCTAKTG